jgi:inner membrane transporter RhtA
VLCALLSSVVPLSIDMLALRKLSPGLFSTLASMHPVWAAIVGLVVLQQLLTLQEWLGIALVVVSNVLVTATNLRRA